jgi:hypothetical protein
MWRTLSVWYTNSTNSTSYMELESNFVTKTQCQPRYHTLTPTYHVPFLYTYSIWVNILLFLFTSILYCLQKYYMYITQLCTKEWRTLYFHWCPTNLKTHQNLIAFKIFDILSLMKNVRLQNGLHRCHHLHLHWETVI